MKTSDQLKVTSNSLLSKCLQVQCIFKVLHIFLRHHQTLLSPGLYLSSDLSISSRPKLFCAVPLHSSVSVNLVPNVIIPNMTDGEKHQLTAHWVIQMNSLWCKMTLEPHKAVRLSSEQIFIWCFALFFCFFKMQFFMNVPAGCLFDLWSLWPIKFICNRGVKNGTVRSENVCNLKWW